QLTPGTLRQRTRDRLIGNIMRRLRLCGRTEGSLCIRWAKDQNVAIADAGMKLKSSSGHRSAQLRLDSLDQCRAVLVCDVASREIAHLLVFDGDEIAADGPVVWPEWDAHGRGFQRGPPRVNLQRV